MWVGGDVSESAHTSPWSKEINRQTYVISKEIERTIVAVGLLLHAIPEIMLCDEMAGTWVEAPCEEAAHEEVYERADTKGLHEDVVKDQLDYEVEQVPFREALGANEAGAEGVEEDLECSGVRGSCSCSA